MRLCQIWLPPLKIDQAKGKKGSSIKAVKYLWTLLGVLTEREYKLGMASLLEALPVQYISIKEHLQGNIVLPHLPQHKNRESGTTFPPNASR
jgi:hypothetical protein